MSILPSLNHGSTSSSSSSRSPSQSSTSNHGSLSSPPQLRQAVRVPHENLRISDAPSSLPDHFSGQVEPAASYSGGSSKEVKGRERHNHGKNPINQDGRRTLHPEDAAHAQLASMESQGKASGTFGSPSSHQSAASSSPQTSSGHLTGKKPQMVSGNHLLNFHYDPIPVSRPQPRAPPRRKEQKRKPYNKDLFFQANYKFVVLDSGTYAAASLDPDKMLCWDDIICLKYSTPLPIQCPICLDDPLCPQITSCGHIFCFPCILQYFSMGEDDIKDECWKKCPLCFTMISSKDLYTICIENVKQYHIGDEIEFVLLTRQKDSFNSSLRETGTINVEEEILDTFSKFTLTSDVELSVREAMSDLDSWIARADSGLVDDIEKLPYVCAAMEQLERRKKYWIQHRLSNDNKASASSYGSSPPASTAGGNYGVCEFASGTISTVKNDKFDWFENSSPSKVAGEFCSPQVAESNELLEDHDRLPSSSLNDNKYSQTLYNGIKDRKDGDSYNFYQAVDGQHIILHPLCMKCLLHHYGCYERLPNRITGKILQLETVTQSEATRRRYRFLSHFSLTTTFQLCEIDVRDVLPAESLSPFMDEIKNREKQRKRLAKKELKDKIKAEAACNQLVPVQYYSCDVAPSFSMDDFEALGSPAVASSSLPTVGERLSFSSVAKLGFAAAHDSPALKTDEIQAPPKIDLPQESSSATGWRNAGASFANITSRAKNVEVQHTPKVNEVGKKGKKPSRVLLSTAGGRRY
ncbi:UNVERIFIED_CONTAM: RING finger protein 10 [Sesamum radiatum]|uniref:RING finger protein 10 n=1 Tax=Sesamum radiatum TaxID=300843 RepID=A0AAW2V983_SESRA